MNPMDMMQFVSRISIFKQQHPKFGAFLSSIANSGVKEGDILEVKYISNEVAIKRLMEQGITLEEAFKIVGTQK